MPRDVNQSFSPAALEFMNGFHDGVVKEVREAVASETVVVVGMQWNPVVKKARKVLDEAGVRYRYLGYGSYLSGWKERLAIKLWSGWPTFPQVFVRGTLLGGCARMQQSMEDGSFEALLSSSGS